MPQQEGIFFRTQTPKSCLFPWAEYQLSKPEVVSRLEEEEELWSVERGIPQDTFSGESQGLGSPGREWAEWTEGTRWDAGVSVCRRAASSSAFSLGIGRRAAWLNVNLVLVVGWLHSLSALPSRKHH